MTEVVGNAPPPPPAPVASPNSPTEVLQTTGEEQVSPREAAQLLANYRWNRDGGDQYAIDPTPEAAADMVRDAPIQLDTGQPESPAPAEEATGEVSTEAVEPSPETEESLELPRSWPKDERERWSKLPPETQQWLLDKDSKDTRAVRQAQNESAEQRRTLDSQKAELDKAIQQYQQATQQALTEAQSAQLGEFSDIKTMDDVKRMAEQDWPRFSKWQAHQIAIQQRQQQMQQLQDMQQKEWRGKVEKFHAEEDAKFADAVKMTEGEQSKLRDAAISYLKNDVGFSDQDLSKLWNSESSLSLRDHRIQLLIRDAVRYRQAQSAARTKAVRPVPVVQRPGSPAARTPETTARDKQLSNRLDQTGHWKDAAELLIARRSAAQRNR